MEKTIKLRPHHILDMIRNYGHNKEFTPHRYGHAQHLIAQHLFSDLNTEIQLVNDSDDICNPCIHLMPNRKCDDVLRQLETPVSKQRYNDSLDEKILPYLGLEQGRIISFGNFLKIVNKYTPGLELICSHPKEDKNYRLTGLINGLRKTGVRI